MKTLFMLMIALILCSCTHTYQFTYTKKSGIEQLLVTKAVDEAIAMMSVDLKGSKAFVDVACLMRDEQSYIKKAFTHRFLNEGVLISEYAWNADYIISVLVKVAGTDGEQYALGVPSIPLPLVAGIATPALTVFSKMVQEGRVEMEVLVYSPTGGIEKRLASLRGNSYYKKYVIIFVPYTSKDIP